MNEKTEHRPYELTNLPFVRADDRGVLNYWSVTPSGNPIEDDATGFEYGRQFIAFMEQIEDHPQLLVHVYHDMAKSGQISGIETGFLTAVGTAGIAHHHSLRVGLVKPGLFGKPIVYPGYVAPKHGCYDRPPSRVRDQDSIESD